VSLQFHLATGYFSMIPGRAFRWAALAALVSCGERDRLVFPIEDPGDGEGPTTEVNRPAAPDTAVAEGELLIVQGRAYDPDGVDAIFIEIGGANQEFAPIQGEGQDTVAFALQLSTLGLGGVTVAVRIHSVDLLGDEGPAVNRQIRVQ
jgi:hypothetical protein